MLKKIVKIANYLDSIGRTSEADFIDSELSKIASDIDEYIDSDSVSFEDELGNTNEKIKSPEEKFVSMLSAKGLFSKIFEGKTAEEVAQELGLENDQSVVSLIEDMMSNSTVYYGS